MKVIRHHNYGKYNESMPDENNIIHDFFYSCFFELDNGKKLCIHTFKQYNYENGVYEWGLYSEGGLVHGGGTDEDDEYNIHYADFYKFGEYYFNIKIPLWGTVTEFPTDEERKCVKDYYNKNIKSLN